MSSNNFLCSNFSKFHHFSKENVELSERATYRKKEDMKASMLQRNRLKMKQYDIVSNSKMFNSLLPIDIIGAFKRFKIIVSKVKDNI